MLDNRKPIFDEVKEAGGRFDDADDCARLDAVLDRLGVRSGPAPDRARGADVPGDVRREIFDEVKAAGGRFRGKGDVDALDAVLDDLGVPRKGGEAPPIAGCGSPIAAGLKAPGKSLAPSIAAVRLMHEFEGCKLKAYPDPGSRDGRPWTIGYGSTGPGIGPGVVWTKEQAEARFLADLQRFGAKVAALIGDAPTTQAQFDALVSLAYNIGTGALATSTALRRHKAGDYAGVPEAIGRFNKNDGVVMKGLTRRRAAEGKLYASG